MTKAQRFVYWMKKMEWWWEECYMPGKTEENLAQWWLNGHRYYAFIWNDQWLKKRWGEEIEEKGYSVGVPYKAYRWQKEKIIMASLTEDELFDYVFPEPETQEKEAK